MNSPLPQTAFTMNSLLFAINSMWIFLSPSSKRSIESWHRHPKILAGSWSLLRARHRSRGPSWGVATAKLEVVGDSCIYFKRKCFQRIWKCDIGIHWWHLVTIMLYLERNLAVVEFQLQKETKCFLCLHRVQCLEQSAHDWNMTNWMAVSDLFKPV